MRSVTLTSALLLCSCTCVSLPQSVKVQPSEDVTLPCSNISRSPTHTFWSRLHNKTTVSCIASMYGSDGKASFCDEFQNGKYEMSANVSTVSLEIKEVDLSDSGLYLCGLHVGRNTILTVTDLNVQGNEEAHVDCEIAKEPDGIAKLCVILGVATVFLTMVTVGLAVKYRKLQTAHSEERNPQTQSPGSDGVSYAALSFRSKAKRSRGPASERDTNVVYAATR